MARIFLSSAHPTRQGIALDAGIKRYPEQEIQSLRIILLREVGCFLVSAIRKIVICFLILPFMLKGVAVAKPP